MAGTTFRKQPVLINADLNERAVLDTESMDWVPSPLGGVARRMLDRHGAESGRATSLVRFDPGSYFDPHDHPEGEEFLVLAGVFSDETGDFGPGSYVRNPPGSRHKPHSAPGCTIFVKLCQMDPDEREHVNIDTQTAAWHPGMVDGLTVMPLFQRGFENVALVKWQPGTEFSRHTHPGGEEIFVLDGFFEDDHGRYPKGTWIRNPPGSAHTPFSRDGGLIYVKTGHLGAQAAA